MPLKTVCHPSDRDINWRPLVHEENFPMQVKNTTIIFTWLLVSFYQANKCVQCTTARNPRERERERVEVCVKIRKAQRVWCIMCSSFAFFRVISFIRIDVLCWITLLLFVWTPSYQFSRMNPFIFKISNFSTNNCRKTQILIVISFLLHSRSIWIIWEQMKHTQMRNTARFSVDSLCSVNPFPEKNVFARQ